MLKLYTKTGCPYCAVVLQKLQRNSIPFSEFNISDAKNSEDILSQGGKRQVPFLVDEDAGISLYESATIVDYLDNTYVKRAKGKTMLAPQQDDVRTRSEF